LPAVQQRRRVRSQKENDVRTLLRSNLPHVLVPRLALRNMWLGNRPRRCIRARDAWIRPSRSPVATTTTPVAAVPTAAARVRVWSSEIGGVRNTDQLEWNGMIFSIRVSPLSSFLAFLVNFLYTLCGFCIIQVHRDRHQPAFLPTVIFLSVSIISRSPLAWTSASVSTPPTPLL